jgi:hypothetical protein
MEGLSLRFVDPVLEGRFQRHGGREGHAAFLVTAGASAVLWPIAGWLLLNVLPPRSCIGCAKARRPLPTTTRR